AMIDAPYPALVTVGHDDVGAVLLDLEQAGSIDVRIDASYGGQGRNSPSIDPSGTASETDAVLSAVAVELATSTRADQVDLVLVGFDAPLEGLDRVSQAASIADVLWRCRRRVRERQALLESVGRRHNWEIRWAEGGDAWDLGVVICTAGAVAEDPWAAAELSRLAGPDGQGLAVVLGASVDDARCHLTAHEGRIEVEMNGAMTSVFGPMTEEEGLLEGVAALVDVAGDLEGSAATEAPYDGLEGNLEPAEQRVAGAGSEPDAVEVEVRVLGPVEIVGAARPFTRAWAVELVVYLALHRKGASSEQWATALWPDRILAPSSLHSTASAARRALGVARSGDDHLPRAHGRLKLGPSVTTDWTRFVDLAARPDVASWRRALELIRGRPFDELRAPDWVLLEGIAATVEASVVDLARRYADHCLTIGGPAEAEWAARKGLQVSPYDERLYRVLLRAADVAGNPAGVESVMSELVRLVAEDIEPYDAVHPETLALYRTLSRRPTGSLGAGR
ncbi:MAG: AfsR/SARP family transcriptional regulator, partial [Acidimicrobiales bacterium]